MTTEPTGPEIIAQDTPGLAPLPAYQCYDCVVCGICCGGIFSVGLRPEEVARIQAQGWEDDPALRGVPLMVKAGRSYRLANRANGACVFLDEHHRCRIHAKFGLEAKPLACQLYPFKFLPAGDAYRVDLRFDCPEVAANRGRAVTACRDDLLRMLPALAPDMPERVPLRAGLSLPWLAIRRITDTVAGLLREPSLDLTQRVVGCVQLSAVLRHLNAVALDDDHLGASLETIVTTILLTLRQELVPRLAPAAGTLASFRQLLFTYGREDRFGARVPLLRRLRHFLRMMRGTDRVPPLRDDLPEVPFTALETPLGIPPDAVVEPLARCLRVRVESLGFFGRGFAGYDYLDGLDALFLTYPAVFWFARLFAAAQDLPAPDRACLERGIRIVHHAHGLADVFRFPLERLHLRALCHPITLRKLVVWYGS